MCLGLIYSMLFEKQHNLNPMKKKIEEFTLYTIEQEKEMARIRKELLELHEKNRN